MVKLLRDKWLSLVTAGALAASLCAASISGASAAGDGTATCNGGSISSGTYSSLRIAGACRLDAGSVSVDGNLTVLSGASLIAAFAGSDLQVGGSVKVRRDGVLILGCGDEPFGFVCFNGAGHTSDTLGHDLVAVGALSVLLHHNSVERNIILRGGGGGVTCNNSPAAFSGTPLSGFPAYASFEADRIAGSVSISNWQSCWLGVFRETVSGDVSFRNNLNADPDGNEIASNDINGDLKCAGNSPSPQIGDSGGTLNLVRGDATGQCTSLAAPGAD